MEMQETTNHCIIYNEGEIHGHCIKGGVWLKRLLADVRYVQEYHAPLHKECPNHHGHKGDPGVTPETCGAVGKRTQVILV